ncbi:MAG TPA: hypothetical protein VEK38_01255, partial [Candidatus Bathyarchaeia archaeon]|nr:hypothetical protein [Candidatus Bathyarchaeia archaeon]
MICTSLSFFCLLLSFTTQSAEQYTFAMLATKDDSYRGSTLLHKYVRKNKSWDETSPILKGFNACSASDKTTLLSIPDDLLQATPLE